MNVTSEHYFMNVSFISDVPQKSDPADAAVWLDGDPDVRQLPVRLDLGHEEVVAVRTQLLRLQDLDRPGLGHLQRSRGLRFELLPFDGDRIREVALEVVGVSDRTMAVIKNPISSAIIFKRN